MADNTALCTIRTRRRTPKCSGRRWQTACKTPKKAPQKIPREAQKETVRLAGAVFPEGFVFSCDLEGNLDLRGAAFLGHAHFSEASIGGDADFRDASIAGAASSLARRLAVTQISVTRPLAVTQISVARPRASIGDYAFSADFSDASFGGDADFRDAFFGSVFEFAPSRVAGRMALSAISARELRIGPCDTRIDGLRTAVSAGRRLRPGNRCA